MSSRNLRALLVSGAAVAGIMLSTPASAEFVLNPADFGVIEGDGQYTVFDHSSDWYIYGFSVTNPNVQWDQTDRPNWYAGTCGSGCGSNDRYMFGNISGPFDFADNIQPGETDNRFFFGSPPASDWTINLVNAQFVLTSVSGHSGGAPEPASWALMITGFGLAGAALRRRRTGPQTA